MKKALALAGVFFAHPILAEFNVVKIIWHDNPNFYIVSPMRSVRRQLITLRWPVVALLLAQLLAQVAITAHASEHAFHGQGSYCDVLEHADHQQGDGIDAAIPAHGAQVDTTLEAQANKTSESTPLAIAYRPRAPPPS